MIRAKWGRALPGAIAAVLLAVAATLWGFWGAMEMYYEGWRGGWATGLPYLVPAAVTLALAVAALTWPRAGGWLLVVVAGAFTTWVMSVQFGRGAQLTWQFVLSWFPLTGILVLTGFLLLLDGRNRRRWRDEGPASPTTWWRRHWRYALVVGLPTLVFVGSTIQWLPTLLARRDDGDRSARLIEGNGVALVWAPAGPGWNWLQSWGGYPSWDMLALYGLAPVGLDGKPGYDSEHATEADMAATGLCRYLAADGVTLMGMPQGIWRLPTADELVGSLALHGENAGCVWDGVSARADCRIAPDKETPLWAPDQAPIYYWVADESSEEEAYFVNYQGAVNSQPKGWGNPRHGYRCVRDP
ncbi:MAG: hypothetical protein ACYC5O_11570 [Anaerolineae bacterium]